MSPRIELVRSFPAGGLRSVAQTNWFIDPVNGSDSAQGDDSSVPLKTGRKFFQRYGGYNAAWDAGPYNCHVMGDMPGRDLLAFAGVRFPNVGMNLHGSATAGQAPAANSLYSGTMNARTSQARATQVRGDITDAAGASWLTLGSGSTSLISTNAAPNKRIRTTSGTNTGMVVFAQKDLTNGKVAVSQWMNKPILNGRVTSISQSEVAVAGTETFVVEKLVNVASLSIDLVHLDSTAIFVVDSIDFTGSTVVVQSMLAGFWGCSGLNFGTSLFVVGGQPSNFRLASCHCAGGFPAACAVNVGAGHLTAAFAGATGGSRISIQADTIAQGCPLYDGSGSAANSVLSAVTGAASFDSNSDGVITRDADIGTGLLWGTGATGVGWTVIPGGRSLYSSTARPTITGSGGDFKLGGATSSRAWDETNSVYTAAITNTWAHLASTVAGGGLGDAAINLINQAMLCAR